MKKLFWVIPLAFLFCFVFGCEKQAERLAAGNGARADLQLDKIPRVVIEGLIAKFPNAEIHRWTKEKEDNIVIYDFEFTQEEWKFEADIKEDGSIHNWEKAIELKDLPEVVKKAADTKHPESKFKEIMEINEAMGGQDVLEGYEIVLETADMKEVEIMVDPNGNIIEDSGEMRPEEE